MGKIIAISNNKGGVGKTTTTLNLGAALSRMKGIKNKVLMVDLDPQSNLSLYINGGMGVKDDNHIYNAMLGRIEVVPVPVAKNLDLIPCSTDAIGGELELAHIIGHEFLLKEVLAPFVDQYDYILVDTKPDISLFTINAYVAANEVLIPCLPESFSTTAIPKISEIVDVVKRRFNPGLSIVGILITQASINTNLHKFGIDFVKGLYKDLAFRTVIKRNISIGDAISRGMNIFDFDENSQGAIDYSEFCNEYLAREDKNGSRMRKKRVRRTKKELTDEKEKAE